VVSDIRAAVCERMAHGDDALQILADICRHAEGSIDGICAGVTILDRARLVFVNAVFPSLSPSYVEGLKGATVAEKPGTCALAIFEGKTVDCANVREDSRFSEAWQSLSLEHGLEALLSIPACDRDGNSLGTFVVGYSARDGLGREQRERAAEIARLCGLVLAYNQRQAEQELLIGELQHRMRNFFSAVGGLAYATLKSHTDPADFRATFDARLLALTQAHVRTIERSAIELGVLLKETLAPYSAEHAISVEGPPLYLNERSAMAFSLAAHELATNAAKYGALSRRAGKLEIRWSADPGETGRFHLRWQESDGAEVTAPSRQGFGQRTICQSIASAFDGQVALKYPPEGLVCEIDAPFSERVGSLDPKESIRSDEHLLAST
jgi:two-component sensor histidine kinase